MSCCHEEAAGAVDLQVGGSQSTGRYSERLSRCLWWNYKTYPSFSTGIELPLISQLAARLCKRVGQVVVRKAHTLWACPADRPILLFNTWPDPIRIWVTLFFSGKYLPCFGWTRRSSLKDSSTVEIIDGGFVTGSITSLPTML